MRLMTENYFIRFLKDEKFIEWRLFPTDELNRYWKEFLQQFPDERGNIELAGEHFLHIKLSSFKLPKNKKQEAMKHLEQSLLSYNRKYKFRCLVYAAVCAVVLTSTILFYFQKKANQAGNELITAANYIVGNELESEDILFVTGNRSISFKNNVDIQIVNKNTAQIKEKNEETEEMPIEQHAMNKLIVPYGKRSKVKLSDGTQVWLNSGSTLEFPSAFSGERREISLIGEMYIEVASDENKSFYVHTSGYEVKAYGTKFNISAYHDSPSSVVLVEGSIGLSSTNRQEIFLKPDEQAIYSEATGTFETQKVDTRSFTSWKEGYLLFEDTPVIEALKQIGRYYNLSFNFGEDVSFQELTCTGKIILSDNLDNVMTALSLISTTEYKRENRHIYIFGRNRHL